MQNFLIFVLSFDFSEDLRGFLSALKKCYVILLENTTLNVLFLLNRDANPDEKRRILAFYSSDLN